VNTIANITHATLSNSTLDVSASTDVEASSEAVIQTVAAAASGGEGLGLAGALTVNTIDNDIDASATGNDLDSSGNVTTIKATDDAKILSMAGSIGASAGAGVGASIAVNDIGTKTVAELSGGTWHARDITISATSTNPNAEGSDPAHQLDANIQTMAAGVGGGQVGGAASAAVNISTATIRADITGGAHVTAENNVGVLAANRQGVDVFAGSLGISADAVGLGIGAVVNYLNDSTSAYIDGGSSVNALAKDASDTLAVNSGTLAHASDLDVSQIHDATDYVNPDLSQTQANVSGLAVNAASSQAVTTLGVSAAVAFDPFGSAAISAMANANVLGGGTHAYINGASINQSNTGAGAQQSVDVRASSHAYDAAFVAGVAAGATDVAATGAIGVNTFNRSTKAEITNTTLTSRGTTNVAAEASQRSVDAVVGLAAGLVGGAGTGVTNVFNADTEANVFGGSLTTGSLAIGAHDETDANMIGGAGAFGGVAVAGTFLLSSSTNTTLATLGSTAGDTAVHTSGAVGVNATSDVNLGSTMVSGAGAGGPAIAGMASFTIVGNTTKATTEKLRLDQGSGDAGAQALNVHATENIHLVPNAASAALSLGSVGVGAVANVALLESNVAASVLDSTIKSAGTVDVAAVSNKTLDVTTTRRSTSPPCRAPWAPMPASAARWAW